jgi:hypothetical protein
MKEAALIRIYQDFKMINNISELAGGFDMSLSLKNREPKIEERFNLHIGHIYRVSISGYRTDDSITYDGILTRLDAFFDDKGFTLHEIELHDGIERFDLSGRRNLFDKKIVHRKDARIVAFGSIIDEAGFYRAYQKLKLAEANR